MMIIAQQTIELLVVIGGAVFTLIVGLALSCWIAAEQRATRRQPPERPDDSPVETSTGITSRER